MKKTFYVILAVIICLFIAFGSNIKQEIKILLSDEQDVYSENVNVSVTDEELHQNSFKYAKYVASNQFIKSYESSSRLNINTLKIGEEILRYTVINNQLTKESDSFIYPIINNGVQCGEVVVYVNDTEFINCFGFKEKIDKSEMFADYDDCVEYHELDNVINNNIAFAYLSSGDSFYIVTKNDVIYQANEKETDLEYINTIQNNLEDTYNTYKIKDNESLDVRDINVINNKLSEKKINKLIKDVKSHYDGKKECGKLINSYRLVVNKDLSISLIKDYDFIFFTAIEGGGFQNRILVVSNDENDFYISSQEYLFYKQFDNISNNIMIRSLSSKIDQLSFIYPDNLSGYVDGIIELIAESIRNDIK